MAQLALVRTTVLLYNGFVAQQNRCTGLIMHIKNTIGSPVEGHDFYNRDKEQARLWDRLETDHILLLAPRRVGKTSLLYRLEATGQSHGFETIYTSVASHNTELAFLEALFKAVAEHSNLGIRIVNQATTALSAIFARVKKLNHTKISVEFQPQEWQAVGNALLSAIREIDGRWLIMLDELPIFLLNLLKAHGRERARIFLDWFREVRIDRRARLSVRWLVCGSIGLDTVTQRERLGDTINDFAIVRLGAFSRPHARSFIGHLATTYKIELAPEITDHLLDKVGWLIPYHLQLLFSLIRDLDVCAPEAAVVDRAYDALLSATHRSYFDAWYQRLREELGPVYEAHALALLEAAALDPTGASKTVMREILRNRHADDDETRYLLAVLENDGYLVIEAERWRFRSPLLRDYWRARVLS